MNGTFEWLEADGLGGFASGTSTGVRSRRYHGLLLVATTPPTGRVMLVNGLEAWIETSGGRYALSTHRYAPDVDYPDGAQRIASFSVDPWPTWTYALEDGTLIEHELLVMHEAPVTAMRWRVVRGRPGGTLSVRPLLSGRDYHATHRENGAFRFDAAVRGERVIWQPYEEMPEIVALANARYTSAPEWYRQFLYEAESTRGLDCIEDLASPGVFTWDLSAPAVLILTTAPGRLCDESASQVFEHVCERESKRRVFPSVLHRGADAYLVRRALGRTIVAGYPWFTDWGRDTFIALRGLCISTGRLDEARDILTAWAGAVSQGMLPNRFPDRGDAPEFNAVDAALWYIVAVDAFLKVAAKCDYQVAAADRAALRGAVEAILDGYAAGTRFGIRMDDDGLLACGMPGVQLTWMDSKIGDWVVTPRTGKPVEIQALWINALAIAGAWSERWAARVPTALLAFRQRFWNAVDGCLFDVVDVDHQRGTADATVRPNQILAVGGLPLALLEPAHARRVVDLVEATLLTPMGLRSLAPDSPGYAPRYEGSPAERDARYHQGTVWPWLMGPFVEAWVRVRGSNAKARKAARRQFLEPLLAMARQTGGHLPEIADAEPPHTPRGCPCQAWSVAEVLRLEADVLAIRRPATRSAVSNRNATKDASPALS